MYTLIKLQKYKKVINLQKIGYFFLANSQLFNTFAMKIYFIKTKNMDTQLIKECEEKALSWLNSPYYDDETKAEIKAMLDNEDKNPLVDAFYQSLEFGTGGLRGIMGAGTNRMNKYIVGMATQGFANYINKAFPEGGKSVVVGHDCRNNGRMFAESVADIFIANGIKVYLFESLRPTPEISFAIRQLGAVAGVNVTASHNPR